MSLNLNQHRVAFLLFGFRLPAIEIIRRKDRSGKQILLIALLGGAPPILLADIFTKAI